MSKKGCRERCSSYVRIVDYLLRGFKVWTVTTCPALHATPQHVVMSSWSQQRSAVPVHGPGSTMATSWRIIITTIEPHLSVLMWMRSQLLAVLLVGMRHWCTSLKCSAMASTVLPTLKAMSSPAWCAPNEFNISSCRIMDVHTSRHKMRLLLHLYVQCCSYSCGSSVSDIDQKPWTP